MFFFVFYFVFWAMMIYHFFFKLRKRKKYNNELFIGNKDNIYKSLIDDRLTPINAYMLTPSYEFDSDVLPDTNFIYTDGIYNYRKFYSYQYNNWYY